MRKFELVKDEFRRHKDSILPTRATENSAGYDFITPVEIRIEPHSTSDLIFTDVKACMQSDELLMLHIRSSIGMKKNLALANTTGIIDSDYYENPDNDGNIGFKLRNLSDKTIVINKGEKVVQGIFVKYLTTDDDQTTTSRTGGFGASGK